MLEELLGKEKYDEIKLSGNIIYKALEISTILFEKDIDKGGLPYIHHLMYVYRHVSTIEEKVIALLHDIMEDKKVSEDDMLAIGFSKKIVEDIKILSRNKKITYKDYIDNIIKKGSKEALEVKMVDLENNMDLTRIKNPDVSDYERVEKRYIPSYEKILNKLKEYE